MGSIYVNLKELPGLDKTGNCMSYNYKMSFKTRRASLELKRIKALEQVELVDIQLAKLDSDEAKFFGSIIVEEQAVINDALKDIALAMVTNDESLRVQLMDQYDKEYPNGADCNVDANGFIKEGAMKGLRYVNDQVGYVDEDEEYY